MTARVQVVLEAKDEASGILRGITSQFGQFGSIIEEVTSSSVNWGNVATQVSGWVVEGIRDAFQATHEYANEVRDLATISGTSAEETSRLIQVLDDYELSTQDAITATRKLTQNGLAPTVETIAELSEKYLSLNTAQAKNQFLLDNFGRSGSEWVNLLKKGKEEILALNEGVSASLILNDQQIQDFEQLRLAQDSLNDNYLAIQISITQNLVPALLELTDAMVENQSQFEHDKETMSDFAFFLAYPISSMLGLKDSVNEASQAAEVSQQAYNHLRQEYGYTADAAGNLENATNNANTAARNSPADINKQISALRSLTGATQEQINATAYMLLQQQAAADGIISEDEYQILIDAGVALGQFDENAGRAYQTIGTLNEYLMDGTITVDQYSDSLNNIPEYIETEIHTVYTSEGTPPDSTAIQVSTSPQETFVPDGGSVPQQRSTMAINETTGGGTVNNFYAPVTLQVDSSVLTDVMEYR